MRLVGFACALLLVGAATAHAEESFEQRVASAKRIRHIDDIVWAFTAACDGGTDTHQRQCRRLRDTRVAELTNATLVVEADRDAFSVGAWNAQKKSASLSLSSCIRCTGVEIDGKSWFVVGNKDGNPAPKFEGGKLKVGPLLDNARTFADEGAAKKFAAGAKTSKVQLVVKVAAKPTWTDGGKQGIALDVLGYRVFSPCDGVILTASPPSGPVEVDKKACSAITSGAAATGGGGGGSADELSAAQVKQAVKPVVAGAKDCYAKYKVAGKAKLKLAIAADGTLSEYEQQGDFANTPTGACIDLAVKNVAFPKSKKARTAVAVPISLP